MTVPRLRCEPGEWAIVTRAPWQLLGLMGRVVLVREPYQAIQPAWRVAGNVLVITRGPLQSAGEAVAAGQARRMDALYDHWLTPLRGGLDVMAELRDLKQPGARP